MNRLLRIAVPVLLAGVLAVGCAGGKGKPAAAPVGGAEPAPVAAKPEPAAGSGPEAAQPEPAPAAPPNPVTAAPKGPPSPVSTEISSVTYPWIKAPADVSLFSGELLVRFSAPVVRQSVEKRLPEQSGVKATWRSDTELLLAVPGCSFLDFSAAGARDAEGRELTVDLNPAFKLHHPCHGGGYTFYRLGQNEAIAGWPYEAPVQDIDPERGLGVGSLGGMLFKYTFASGEVVPLVRVQPPGIARFVTGGNLLVATPGQTRLVDVNGRVLQEWAGAGEPAALAVAADGQTALLLTMVVREQVSAHRFDLAAGTVKDLGSVNQVWDRSTLVWPAGGREVQALWDGTVAWVLNVDTGKTAPGPRTGEFRSPDGRWVARQNPAGLFPAGSDQPVVALAQGRPVTQTVPVWSPDSRYVLMSNGELVDLQARQVVKNLYYEGCGPVVPDRIWTMGQDVYLTYILNCH